MNYNFKTVSEKHPKSVALLKKYLGNDIRLRMAELVWEHEYTRYDEDNNETGFTYDETFNPLELQFFFDEQGIMGYVEYGVVHGHELGNLLFSYVISITKNRRTTTYLSYAAKDYEHSYILRSEAMTALFDKCFSLLEETLNHAE